MSRVKPLKSVNDIARKHGVEPYDLVLGRIKAVRAKAIQAERNGNEARSMELHAWCVEQSLRLMPYTRHSKGAEPVKEIKDAAGQGRLILVVGDD